MILRADGDHGQGEAFQKLFFRAVKDRCDVVTTDGGAGLLSCPDSGYQVLIEETIGGLSNINGELQKGRMDISLHHPDEWIIGIENKPFAGDQPKQIERYLDDMAQRADAGHGLVYLSGTGQSPQEHSISGHKSTCANVDGKFCVFSYKSDLVPFLQQCSQICRSPRFSNFLDDFSVYVLPPLLTDKAICMSDSKIIESLLDEDPVAWETANLLHEHYGGIVRRRGMEHFNQATQELPGALSEAIGGQWTAFLERSLHKRLGYPLRIRNIAWPQTNFFVIGF